MTVLRSGASEALELETGADGQVVIADLLVGQYAVSVARVLTADEQESVSGLAPVLSGLNAFGGGTTVTTQTSPSTATVEVEAGRPGSLVISEFWDFVDFEVPYRWGSYVEVFNNADTTIYLDGKILASGMFNIWEDPRFPCDSLDPWRLDPDGLWSEWHFRFPGTGRSYPLGAGEAAIVAMDAIDHRQFSDAMPDLSDAEFETIGTPDVDNPSVPNMLQAGVREWDTALGHGLGHSIGPLFLAEDIELESLPVDDLPGVTYPQLRRIPAEAVLDVLTLSWPTSFAAEQGLEMCQPAIAPRFDRQTKAPPGGVEDTRATARRVLARLSDGRVILQRTGTSAVDFELTARSPGTVR